MNLIRQCCLDLENYFDESISADTTYGHNVRQYSLAGSILLQGPHYDIAKTSEIVLRTWQIIKDLLYLYNYNASKIPFNLVLRTGHK